VGDGDEKSAEEGGNGDKESAERGGGGGGGRCQKKCFQMFLCGGRFNRGPDNGTQG
jgi:hypothetical protein